MKNIKIIWYINNNNVDIIPFEIVDGLTVEKVLFAIYTRNFGFICYNHPESKNKIANTIYCAITFLSSYLMAIKDITVDKVIENYLKKTILI